MWESIEYDSSRFDDIIKMSIENYGIDNDICDSLFIKHQYFDNPAGNALIELAIDPNEDYLAGQYVVQPKKIRVFGKEETCLLSLNTLTRERYRGQGIFVGLAENIYKRAAAKGYAFVYGAPNPNSYNGFINKLSFSDIHHFPLFARPISLSRIVKEKTNSDMLAFIFKPFQLICRNRVKDCNNVIELDEDNITLMDEFWENIKNKYNIMFVRNAEYTNYRYFNVPRRKYYVYVALNNGKIVAFIAGRKRKVAGFEAGMITDFLFIPGFEKEAQKLVKVIINRMKIEGASLAACVILSHTEETKILKRCGLFRVPDKWLPQPTPLILRTLNKGPDSKRLKDISNWYFTTGDYDVV